MREQRSKGRLRLQCRLLMVRHCCLRVHEERLAVRLVLVAAAAVGEGQHLLQSQAAVVEGVAERSLVEVDGHEVAAEDRLRRIQEVAEVAAGTAGLAEVAGRSDAAAVGQNLAVGRCSLLVAGEEEGAQACCGQAVSDDLAGLEAS